MAALPTCAPASPPLRNLSSSCLPCLGTHLACAPPLRPLSDERIEQLSAEWLEVVVLSYLLDVIAANDADDGFVSSRGHTTAPCMYETEGEDTSEGEETVPTPPREQTPAVAAPAVAAAAGAVVADLGSSAMDAATTIVAAGVVGAVGAVGDDDDDDATRAPSPPLGAAPVPMSDDALLAAMRQLRLDKPEVKVSEIHARLVDRGLSGFTKSRIKALAPSLHESKSKGTSESPRRKGRARPQLTAADQFIGEAMDAQARLDAVTAGKEPTRRGWIEAGAPYAIKGYEHILRGEFDEAARVHAKLGMADATLGREPEPSAASLAASYEVVSKMERWRAIHSIAVLKHGTRPTARQIRRLEAAYAEAGM